MTKLEKKKQEELKSEDDGKTLEHEQKEKKATSIEEETPDEKLKTIQDKLLRTIAEM